MADNLIPQQKKAIQLNRYYAHCLRRSDGCIGWVGEFGPIAKTLGLRSGTVTEQSLVQAVYSWQKSQPGLTADGILGINTCSRLNSRSLIKSGLGYELPPGIRSPLAIAGELSPATTGSPSVFPARGFLFVVFEQLPEIGAKNIIRKVAVVPQNFALQPINPLGRLTAAQHALGISPGQSQWLSGSNRPFGAANFKGKPLLINTAKIAKGGGRIVTTMGLIADLQRHAIRNPSTTSQVNRLINAITHIEGEVLVEGSTPPRSARPLRASHNRYVKAAETLWEQFDTKKITRAELKTGLSSLDDAYKGARVVGRVGRVVTVVGVVFTAVDIGQATHRSIELRSIKPIAAETIRQVGGWGSAIAGAKVGGLVGAAFGIETGPGAIVTGAIGAIIFGAAGYFGADWVADHISEN